MSTSDLIIKIPEVLDINSWEEIGSNNLFNNGQKFKKILFDFSETRYVRPIGLIMAVALMKYSKHSEIAQNYYLRESASESVRSYLERMDFYNQFHIEKNTINRRDRSRSLCEISEIKEESYSITQKLKKIIEAQVKINPELSEVVTYSIGEIIDNIEAHSFSPINGYICAQTYSDNLEIAIADCGIGIKSSLNSCPAYANIESHEEAIILATGKKVTSKSSRHAGEGLFFTRRFLDANNGKLFILSGDARVEFKSGFNPLVNRVNYWQGTIVGMIFDLNTPVNAKQIFDSEYPEDADDMLEDIF